MSRLIGERFQEAPRTPYYTGWHARGVPLVGKIVSGIWYHLSKLVRLAGWPESKADFAWNIVGPPANHLAEAILFDATGDPAAAEILAQLFRQRIINTLEEHWELTVEEVRAWVADHQVEVEAWRYLGTV